ncbi:MAG: hypothetical protein WEA58_12945 [Balneolaceae bacterium]
MAKLSSSGHKLGQLVGDWWEEYVVLPLLMEIANDLDLYLDHRFRKRKCRSGTKIIWKDDSGNQVDYDFVLELEGSDDKTGVPVGFLEVFWRRGSRHSKDKVRDDTGKLRPMRSTYPTARYLGIAACGSLTVPAREYVRYNDIDLFYVSKNKIIQAFKENGLTMEYPDRLGEEKKSKLAQDFDNKFDSDMKKQVSNSLLKILGKPNVASYKNNIISRLTSMPLEIRFQEASKSEHKSFDSITKATEFLKAPTFNYSTGDESYCYEISYSDGYEFSREVGSLTKLRQLHKELVRLINHMDKIFE